MDEKEPTLVGRRRAEPHRLLGDAGGGEHDVAEFAGLARGEVGIVGTLALQADDVGHGVAAAPFGVERADLVVSHHRDGDQAVPVDALLCEDQVAVGADLVLGEERGHAVSHHDVVLVSHA